MTNQEIERENLKARVENDTAVAIVTQPEDPEKVFLEKFRTNLKTLIRLAENSDALAWYRSLLELSMRDNAIPKLQRAMAYHQNRFQSSAFDMDAARSVARAVAQEMKDALEA
jgi:hypothetical protein